MDRLLPKSVKTTILYRLFVIAALLGAPFVTSTRAQTNNAGIGTTSPDASAILELSSTSRGLLAPRVTTTQRTAIATPATGLLVFDITLNLFYYYNGTLWLPIAANSVGWSLTGDAGTVATTNFLGTTDAIDLHIRTNNKEHIALTTSGWMGFDTLNPSVPWDFRRDASTGVYTSSFRTQTSNYGLDMGSVGSIGTYAAIRGVKGSSTLADIYLQSTHPGNINGNVGINTTAPNTKVDIAGDLAIRRYDTTAVNGANNNFDVRGYSFVRISGPTAAFSITGVTNGFDGKLLILFNSTSQNMTISNMTGSSVGNQISTQTGGNIVTVGTGSVEMIYSGSDSKWIVLSFQP